MELLICCFVDCICGFLACTDTTTTRVMSQVDPQEPGGYTKQPLSLEEKMSRYPEFVAASPRGLVPAVTHFGQHVWESIHVCEYIDAVFTGNTL
jgi:Glutathione S-transferase, N-terminal domain